MRIHYLQHVEFEGLGCIENWCVERKHELSFTKLYQNTNLPNMEDFDFLIILGGSMSVNDEKEFHWLKAEKQFIKLAIQSNKKVLGICLGAQLIASVLGTKVYKNKVKEIGWFPIAFTNYAKEILTEVDTTLETFHWHGETFDLPNKALLLANSVGCKNQGFIYEEKIIGLQFHWEVTEKWIEKMITFGKDELVEAEFIQSSEMILNKKYLMQSNNEYMFSLLTYFENI